MPAADIAAVCEYFRALAAIHDSGQGVSERSYYPALANFLNAIGATLDPKVHCVLELQNRGEGQPDGGLFAVGQRPGQKPAHGAVEAKSVDASLDRLAESEQVNRYWQGYGQVLATNLRAFTVIGSQPGSPLSATRFETIALAPSPEAFWDMAAHPTRSAAACGLRLAEFVRRALLQRATLSAPADVAFFLASYAREALARIESARLEDLASLRTALEQALGLQFEGDKGEHFFRSSLVQTLFYGLFSSWAIWAEANSAAKPGEFRWREAAWILRLPVLRKLFHELADPRQLRSLGLAEVLDWASAALQSVHRGEFFSHFHAGNAVQYFYEPFLESFDPELRRALGVWYTPPEIVEYMVARVDQVLRSELGLELGLADSGVVVLDPCCGTGSFLVEVLRSIQRTLVQKGEAGLAGAEVRRAACERIFGFEILPAPFVVAHLQIGMLLAREALAFESDERAAVFLTNALTGWEPPKKGTHPIPWAELERERSSAGRVKREAKVLVVLGNPPYNAYAGVSPAEEEGLVEPYKQGLVTDWGIKKFNLDDLYVRFFRLAERRIAEMTGRGIVCYISNYSWLSDPSFVVLRRHLLNSFDKFWVDNLHGDRRISEYAPDGHTSETVFAIAGFSPGIRQGVATSLWVKRGRGPTRVYFRDDINAARASERRKQLSATLNIKPFDRQYDTARPSLENRFSFRPTRVDDQYLSWPRITELCATPPLNGLMEKRGGALFDIDRDALAERMRAYFDRSVDWAKYKADSEVLAGRQSFDPQKTRAAALKAEKFSTGRLLRFAVRPFDTRWCYYTAVPQVWNRARPALREQLWKGNRFLLSRFRASRKPEGPPFYFVTALFDDHLLSPDACAFPFNLRDGIEPDPDTPRLLDDGGRVQTANLSPVVRHHLAKLGYTKLDRPEIAALVWYHVLAVGFSPRYLAEHADGIRQDWPRIPLPSARQALEKSAELGARLAALLDTESPTALPPQVQHVAEPRHVLDNAIRPADCSVTVGWGRAGSNGVVMPGRGRLLRHASGWDVYINDSIYWSAVPVVAWEFIIGGYQVLKKWLSYRESPILGRPLTLDELRQFRDAAQRLAAIALLHEDLDKNYFALTTPG